MLIQPLIWVCLDAGRLDEARDCADEALEAATTSGVSFMESRMALNRARVDLAAGNLTDAAEFATRAITVARSTDDTFVTTTAVRFLAQIEEREGRYETARDLIASVLDDVAETQSAEQLAQVRADVQRCSELAQSNG
jgi:ATP/maltotriose-dependent transcriptional regulator MalT